MSRSLIFSLWILAGAGGAFFSLPAVAGSFEVAPTTISLPESVRSAALFITNRNDRAVNIQVEAFDWRQGDKGDELTPSDALMISPPMVQLAAGRKQTVRLAVNPEVGNDKERSFRLVVSELPAATAKAGEGVQVLLQFSIPVFIAPTENSPLLLEWKLTADAEGLWLSVHNNGTHHAKLSGFMLTPPNAAPIAVAPDTFRYVLSGASYRWKVEGLSPQQGELFTLSAQDESDGAIRASIAVAQRP